MKKNYIYIIMCIVALMLAGCKGDDLPVQYPDGYGRIAFTVDAEEMVTRAEDNNYDSKKYPSTIGIFCPEAGICNSEATLNGDTNTWSLPNYWSEYADVNTFTFFGYMPYVEGATLTQAGAKQTLAFPFTMPADSCVTFVQKNAPLVCRGPITVEGLGKNVQAFNMDQTLIGFRLQFSLGDKMDKVRDITIKSVVLKDQSDRDSNGDKIADFQSVFAKSGTCSRVYTENAGKWSSGDITWTDIVKPDATQTIEVYNNPKIDESSTPLLLTTSMQQWGSDFFVIPSTGFTPIIEVTYDVAVDGTSPAEITRETVTSTITLNKSNFPKYDPTKADKPGYIYPIQIKIVPSYLYVLADADQQSGYIVIQ